MKILTHRLPIFVSIAAIVLVLAGSVYAYWRARIHAGVVLGTKEVCLEYSQDGGVSWTKEPPVIISSADFNQAGLLQKSFLLRSCGSSPANHRICMWADGVITEGDNWLGSVSDGKLPKYIAVEKFSVAGEDRRALIPDSDSDSIKSYADLMALTPDGHQVCFDYAGADPVTVLFGLQWLVGGLNVDSIMGDSLTGNVYWQLD